MTPSLVTTLWSWSTLACSWPAFSSYARAFVARARFSDRNRRTSATSTAIHV